MWNKCKKLFSNVLGMYLALIEGYHYQSLLSLDGCTEDKTITYSINANKFAKNGLNLRLSAVKNYAFAA